MHRQLGQLGDVTVVAPATEQSGVSHSITYLSPLIVQEIFVGEERRGWAVEGSPADCVKIGISEICSPRPDLVVSGINAGLNAGINVLYSGTVAAAIEGAFFRITSVAVSLEYDEHAQFDDAARRTRQIIQTILDRKGPAPNLYNINIPTAALRSPGKVRVVPMGIAPYAESFEKRSDPRGRSYFWATGELVSSPEDGDTDLAALAQGHVTLTPLHFDLTSHGSLAEMRGWEFETSS